MSHDAKNKEKVAKQGTEQRDEKEFLSTVMIGQGAKIRSTKKLGEREGSDQEAKKDSSAR
jgi:hypothetical protein